MTKPVRVCPDCENEFADLNRRDFLKTAGLGAAAIVAASSLPRWAGAAEATSTKAAPETLVKQLFDSLTPEQRPEVAFDWDYMDPKRGLLRTHVSNNWHITKPNINGDFYTKDQQEMIRSIYEGLYQPEWVAKIDQQLKDDNKGKTWGNDQNIAIFGKPGEGKFELVMTGRHLTIRCDGHSEEHVAFGGPIFYGHDAGPSFNEEATHPGNVFWPQALEANKVFTMLDGKQRKSALVPQRPAESAVAFRGNDGKFPGIAITDLSSDQKEQVQKTLQALLGPYRNSDREVANSYLTKQGGLDKCSLAFYQAGDIGDDGVWDNWRIEGPSFVWYFRGEPHVHVWVNIADDASVKTNAQG